MADEIKIKCPECYGRVTPEEFDSAAERCHACLSKPKPVAKAPIILAVIWSIAGVVALVSDEFRANLMTAGGGLFAGGVGLFFSIPGLILLFALKNYFDKVGSRKY